MSSYPRPKDGYQLGEFNPAYFEDLNGYLTLKQADALYFHKTGGVISGSARCLGDFSVDGTLSIGGSVLDISVITGITNGQASANKALIVDASRNIENINSLTATNLYGTLQTASQTNITSLGTLTGLNCSGNSTITNSYLLCTGDSSAPTNTNGFGLRFSSMLDGGTGVLRARNYQMSTDNNITINEGNIYIKNDRNVGIDVARASIAYKLDVNGDVNCRGSLRIDGSVICDSSRNATFTSVVSSTEAFGNSSTKCATTAYVQNEVLPRSVFMSGFENRTDSTISYDASTRIFTISGTYNVWVRGIRYAKTGSLTTTAHATTAGITYYIYFNSSGTLTIGTSMPDLLSVAMTAIVYYYSATETIFLEERHGIEMDSATHIELHRTIGTYYVSGLALTGYTLNGTTDVENTFASSSGVIADEDIQFSISAVAETGNPYTVMSLTGANSLWTLSFANATPFKYGTYIQYNQWTGSTWQLTDLATNNWVNYYVLYLPSISVATQMVLIPGQTTYVSLASAQAESFSSLSISTLLLPEYLVLYQITFKASASLTTLGKCQITAVQRYISSRSVSSSSSVANHQALSGLQLAASGNTYGHIDDQAQTIAGVKTFSSGINSTLTYSGTNNGPISLTNTSSTGRSTILFNNDSNQLELGYRGSNLSPNSSFYIYRGAYWMVIDSTGKMGLGGNQTPAYTLDITGDCNVSGAFKIGGTTINTSYIGSPGTFTANKSLVLDANAYLFSSTGSVNYLGTMSGTYLKLSSTVNAFNNSDGGLSLYSAISGNSGSLTLYSNYTTAGAMQRWITLYDGNTSELRLDFSGYTDNYRWSFYPSDTRSPLNLTTGTNGSSPMVYLKENRAGIGIFTSTITSGKVMTINGAVDCNSSIIATNFAAGPNPRVISGSAISYFNSGASNGTNFDLLVGGVQDSARDRGSIAFYYYASGDTRNQFDFNFYGSSSSLAVAENFISCFNSGSKGYGKLHVNGGTNYTFTGDEGYVATLGSSWTITGHALPPPNWNATISISCTDYVLADGMVSLSDERLKKDVVPLEFDVDNYLALQPSEFTWIKTEERDVGFIAQDVLRTDGDLARNLVKVLPNVDEEVDADEFVSNRALLSVNYSKLPLFNHACLRHLREENTELKSEVSQLKSEVSHLYKMLDSIMSNMRNDDGRDEYDF